MTWADVGKVLVLVWFGAIPVVFAVGIMAEHVRTTHGLYAARKLRVADDDDEAAGGGAH